MVLDQSALRSLIHYDPESGEFTWLKRPEANNYDRTWNTKYAGTIAGHRHSDGYPRISIKFSGLKKLYKAHRLVWLYVHGEFPKLEIDHINRIRSDNRIVNLRLATASQNHHNAISPKNNTSGLKGVVWHKNCALWQARIQVDGKTKSLGYFRDLAAAKEAYVAASIAHVKGFSIFAEAI